MSFLGDSPDDFAKWNAWDCSFYGRIPERGAESEGTLVLGEDIQIQAVEWTFPRGLLDSWVFDLILGDEIIQTVSLGQQSEGRLLLNPDNTQTQVWTRGSVIQTRVRCLLESDEFPDFLEAPRVGLGYSIILRGFSQRRPDSFTLASYLMEEPLDTFSDFTEWQKDNA